MAKHPSPMKFLLAILLAAVLSACATLNQEGLSAMNAGNLKLAEQKLLAAVRQGDSDAWNNLGVLYDRTGRRPLADRAFLMSARYGNATAQQNLVARGLPVPAADLRKAEADSSAFMVEMMRQSAARNQSSSPSGPKFCDSKAGLGGTISTTCY